MVRIIFFWVLCLYALSIHAQVRQAIDFNADWRFQLGDDSLARKKDDDSRWRKLQLPHDWNIESDFIKDAPATNQGGSLPGGIGWYRKTFVLPATVINKQVILSFDGVYQQSEVWINGYYLGTVICMVTCHLVTSWLNTCWPLHKKIPSPFGSITANSRIAAGILAVGSIGM